MSILLMPKIDIPGCFTKGKVYKAIYDFDGQGWLTVDDSEHQHWLSPYDGKDHSNIKNETWILKTFDVISTT